MYRLGYVLHPSIEKSPEMKVLDVGTGNGYMSWPADHKVANGILQVLASRIVPSNAIGLAASGRRHL